MTIQRKPLPKPTRVKRTFAERIEEPFDDYDYEEIVIQPDSPGGKKR